MKLELGNVVKTTAKASFYILSRMIGFGLLGLAMNAVILLILSPEMKTILSKGGTMHIDGGGGGPMVILVLFFLLVAYWPVTLMVMGFGAAFPALYFILGQKHGIRKAIHYCVSSNRELIMEYTVDRLWNHASEKAGLQEKTEALLTKSKILDLLPAYLKKLGNMPRPMRLVTRHFINTIGLSGIVSGVVKNLDDQSAVNIDAVSQAIKDRASGAFEEKLVKPDLKWFGILAGINIAACAIIKIVV